MRYFGSFSVLIGFFALLPNSARGGPHQPTSIREFKECREEGEAGGIRYRMFFDSNYAYRPDVIDFLVARFSGNSILILGANPQDKDSYSRSRDYALRLKAQGKRVEWSSNRIGPGMPNEFPSDRTDILEYTAKMPSMKRLGEKERLHRWMKGAWIDMHREWLIEESRAGVFCTEWDNIHYYDEPGKHGLPFDTIGLFMAQQRWERDHENQTGQRISTRIALKNVYPGTAKRLAESFRRFREAGGTGNAAGLNPARFCPFVFSEEHMTAGEKRAVDQELRPFGISVANTLNTHDYRTIPSKQPCGHLGTLTQGQGASAGPQSQAGTPTESARPADASLRQIPRVSPSESPPAPKARKPAGQTKKSKAPAPSDWRTNFWKNSSKDAP